MTVRVWRTIQFAASSLAALALLLLFGQTAQAGGVVGTGTPASCTGNAFMNTASGGGQVTFNCGPGLTTINAPTIVVTNTMTIIASDNIILDGGGNNQLFLVTPTGNLTLRDITLANGEFSDGGCIFVDADATHKGRVTLQSSRVEGCVADGVNDGGAIFNRGILAITDSVLLGNIASRHGGAIFTSGDSSTTIVRTTFSNNHAIHPVTTAADGGALFVLTGTVTISQTLFAANTAERNGGGLYNSLGTLTVIDSTFSGNGANGGGGFFADGGSRSVLNSVTIASNRANTGAGLWRFNNLAGLTLFNTIVAGNLLADGVTDGLDCDGPAVSSAGFNLISDGTCVSGSVASDQRNTNPLLGPLQYNGGPTLTHYPQPGSPAIDQGTTVGCPAFDQRGVRRPLGGRCDVGAVEVGSNLFLPVALRK